MRRWLALLLLGGCVSGRVSTTAVEPLRVSPGRVFKLADPGGEGTESCTFMLLLPPGAVPVRARIATLAGERELESRTLTADGLRGMTIEAGSRSVMRLQVRRPRGDSFDRVRGSVETKDGAAMLFEAPVAGYTPVTKLIFPFHGEGIVSSGAVNDGGHRNNSGQFAIDALALTGSYAPMICAEDRNECSAGFGRREIVAPADGVVVRAWNDFADNERWDGADRKLFTLPDGTVVDTGNSVVLDHGNGEFSLIAHMKRGSVVVREGQRVRQGEKIGLLGNSGESYGPHLHYQLQDGPDPARANGLPPAFEGGPSRLTRGVYFQAR